MGQLYNLAVTPKEYNTVFDAVTNEICELFRNTVEDRTWLTVTVGKTHKNNKMIGALFQQDIISTVFFIGKTLSLIHRGKSSGHFIRNY